MVSYMAGKNIVHITAGNFNDEVNNSNIPVLIDFWAPWCGPCRSIAPILEQLSEKYDGKIKIAKLNVDDEPALASQFKIMGIPTLTLFKNGQIFKQLVGLRTSAELEDLFNKAL